MQICSDLHFSTWFVRSHNIICFILLVNFISCKMFILLLIAHANAYAAEAASANTPHQHVCGCLMNSNVTDPSRSILTSNANVYNETIRKWEFVAIFANVLWYMNIWINGGVKELLHSHTHSDIYLVYIKDDDGMEMVRNEQLQNKCVCVLCTIHRTCAHFVVLHKCFLQVIKTNEKHALCAMHWICVCVLWLRLRLWLVHLQFSI